MFSVLTMPRINRRHFLQFSGSALASIGLSQLQLSRQGMRYGKVLAQPTPKKLALLVGINAYDQTYAWPSLNGCTNDVRMQQELLIHRFGFNPQDILVITDQQATRQGIIDAFQNHLIAQASAGDVVVFHYSGHGSQIIDPNPYREDNRFNSTLVPIDSPLPNDYQRVGGTVNDIMGKDLFMLMSLLKTDAVTAILDSCHSGGGRRGAVTVRSRDGANSDTIDLHPSDAVLESQAQLQSQLGWTDQELYKKRQEGIAKGVVISSAAEEQLAVDAYFNGFYAGAFTYLLTQYLWQQTGDRPLTRSFVDIDRATQGLAAARRNPQDPDFETNLAPDLTNAPLYFLPKQTPPAEAVILEQDGDMVKLWLGGIHPDGLHAFQAGAIFSALNSDSGELGQVQLISTPNGLEAEGKFIDASPPPTSDGDSSVFLQEYVRTVPNDLVLKVGVDESLRDQLKELEEAIAPLDRIQFISPDGENRDDVDYFLGRVAVNESRFVTQTLGERPPAGSIVLLYPELSVVPNSWGLPGESATDAITNRFQSKFKTLLATRILRSVLNPGSSDLRVDATISLVDGGWSDGATSIQVRGGQRGTGKTDPDEALSPLPENQIITDMNRLPLGTLIQIEVTNHETRPVNTSNGLYVAVLATDSAGDMAVVFPSTFDAPDQAAFVESGQTITIPDPDRPLFPDEFHLRVVPPVGVTEVLVIASAVPLRQTLLKLSAIAQAQKQRGLRSRGTPLAPPSGDEFIEVAESLLDDLNEGTRGLGVEYHSSSSTRGASPKQLTALSITFDAYDPNQEE